MDFWKVIEERKSVRNFQEGKLIEEDQLRKIVRAGKLAPSAGGIYPVNFIVVTDESLKDKLASASFGQKTVQDAAALIVVTADPDKSAAKYSDRGKNLYAIRDAAAAVENLLLAATALGVGSCWIGGFDENEVSIILRLPDCSRPLTIVALGWEKE